MFPARAAADLKLPSTGSADKPLSGNTPHVGPNAGLQGEEKGRVGGGRGSELWVQRHKHGEGDKHVSGQREKKGET